jgi:hypothetical protein
MSERATIDTEQQSLPSNHLGIDPMFVYSDSPLLITPFHEALANKMVTDSPVPTVELLHLTSVTVLGGGKGGLTAVLSLLTDSLRKELALFDVFWGIRVLGVLSVFTRTSVNQIWWWKLFSKLDGHARFIDDPLDCAIGWRESGNIMRWACIEAQETVFAYVRLQVPSDILKKEGVELARLSDNLSFCDDIGHATRNWPAVATLCLTLEEDWCRKRARQFALESLNASAADQMWHLTARRGELHTYMKIVSGLGAPDDCSKPTTRARHQFWVEYLVLVGDGVPTDEASVIAQEGGCALFQKTFNGLVLPNGYVGTLSGADEVGRECARSDMKMAAYKAAQRGQLNEFVYWYDSVFTDARCIAFDNDLLRGV